MQTFNNGEEFKDQLLRYVLKTQYDVKLNRWESTKHAAICTEPKCQWRIYCSVEKPLRKWMVKVYVDKHNHVPTGRARMLKRGTIAKLFKEEARRRPDIRSTDIKDELMHQYNVSVSIYKCQKARRIALDMVLETQKEQFVKLWDYEAELLRADENTTTEIVTVEKDGKKLFDRFYVCFEQLRRTWKKSCRPLIGLDGAFLKWELKGEILSAVGSTCKNQSYVAEGPKRKRGRPRKIPVDSESNPNPPKRQRKTQSQSSIPAPATISSAPPATSTFPPASSAPEASATGRRRGRPPGRGRGRPPVRRQPSIPRGIGLYICPFTDRVFDVRGNRARDLGGGQAYNTSQGPRQL